MTPVLRDPDPCELLPPRTELLVRMIRARERHCLEAGEFLELLFD